MTNEQERQTTLDHAIDHVVRDMMHVEPRPGLRLRVLNRLSQQPQHGGWVGLGALASAALLVLIFASTIDRSSELQPASPGQAAVEPSPTPGAPPPGSERPDPQVEVAPVMPEQTAKRAEPTPESIFGPRDQKVRGASTPSSGRELLRPVGPAGIRQTPNQASAGKPETGKEPPQRPDAGLTNLKIDVTVTDDRESVATTPKTVSIVTVDRQRGRVRASAPHAVLNVDAQPEILADGRIRVHMTVSYQAIQQPGERSRPASLEKSITAILDEGKTLTVSQSTDPASERTVKVDIKATLLK